MHGEAMRLTTVVRRVTRRKSSVNGNPTKVVHCGDDAQFVTAPDAMVAFAISDNWRDERVVLVLDSKFRVIGLERLD